MASPFPEVGGAGGDGSRPTGRLVLFGVHHPPHVALDRRVLTVARLALPRRLKQITALRETCLRTRELRRHVSCQQECYA